MGASPHEDSHAGADSAAGGTRAGNVQPARPSPANRSVGEPASDRALDIEQRGERMRKTARVRGIALGLLGALGLGVGLYYLLAAGHESTDDAQVEAEVVAVPARTGGVVLRVNIIENQRVKAGDVIAELDSAPQAARLAQAEAELKSAEASAQAADAEVAVVQASARGSRSVAEATLKGSSVGLVATADEIAQAEAAVAAATAQRRQAELELDRAKKLFAESAVPRQRLDGAQNAFDAADAAAAQARARLAFARSSTATAQARVSEARARVTQTSAVDAQIQQAQARAAVAHARSETARAARDLAKLDFSYTKIVAPADGVASKKSIVVGQMVAPGQPVVMLVPTRSVWVVANFKETQLMKIRAGQPAEVEIDAFPGLRLEGEVESLSGATGSRFSLLPPENATGNFVKVVQRVPVRIKLKNLPTDRELRPGMSADVTVNVRKG